MLAVADDSLRYLEGVALLAVVSEYGRQLRDAGLGENVRRRPPFGSGISVHPHVERAVVLERKSALRLCELQIGNPEVEKHGVRPREIRLVRKLRHAAEVVGYNRPSSRERGEALGRYLARFGVLVEAVELRGRERFEYTRAVAREAERRVNEYVQLLKRSGRGENFVKHYGGVLFHISSSSSAMSLKSARTSARCSSHFAVSQISRWSSAPIKVTSTSAPA